MEAFRHIGANIWSEACFRRNFNRLEAIFAWLSLTSVWSGFKIVLLNLETGFLGAIDMPNGKKNETYAVGETFEGIVIKKLDFSVENEKG